MTPLDTAVRRSLLLYPSLYETRWQVLFHLFISNGNGLEWHGGQLIDPRQGEFNEAAARAEFFDDIEKLFADRPDEEDAIRKKTMMARRQFQLDNVDGLTVEPRYASGARVDTDYFRNGFYEPGSRAFTAPVDTLEPSYRAGILETLNDCIVGLYRWRTDPRLGPIRERMIEREIAVENLTAEQRLQREEWAAALVREVLAEERETSS